MSATKQSLPWACPDHPNAKVVHIWDQEHRALNGLPAGIGYPKNHKYACSVCGERLAAKRKKEQKDEHK